MNTSALWRAAALATATSCVLTACASSQTSADRPATDLEAAPADEYLADVCPAEVGIQLQWQPQSDMGALFEMMGPDYQVDTQDKSVTGTLVADGRDTGVDLTLKAGGPAIGFQSVPSQLYLDDSLIMGIVHGDMLMAAAEDQPVVGVTPLLRYSPAILMWDPATHPDFTSVADVGESDVTVVTSDGQIYPQWLVARGILQQSQIDPSYDGSPARFVSDPTIVQQGFANSEPYSYENDTPAWDRPVAYGLVRDVGYDIYASNMSVRADRLDELSPCLERLVPIIQRAGVAYAQSPDDANATIVDMIAQDSTYSPYTEGEAAYGAQTLVEQGLLAAEDDGTFGVYDPARVALNLEDLRTVLATTGNIVPADTTAEDLFTNRFSDPSIVLD